MGGVAPINPCILMCLACLLPMNAPMPYLGEVCSELACVCARVTGVCAHTHVLALFSSFVFGVVSVNVPSEQSEVRSKVFLSLWLTWLVLRLPETRTALSLRSSFLSEQCLDRIRSDYLLSLYMLVHVIYLYVRVYICTAMYVHTDLQTIHHCIDLLLPLQFPTTCFVNDRIQEMRDTPVPATGII